MEKQLLIVNSPLSSATYSGWRVIWCTTQLDCQEDIAVADFIEIPRDNMPPLSQGLFALDLLHLDRPLVISSYWLPETILNNLSCSLKAKATFSSPDSGYISFPLAEQFICCTKEAMRAHDPLKGPICLKDVWHQVLLKSLN